MGSVVKRKGKAKKARGTARTLPQKTSGTEIKKGESVIEWILKNPVKDANLPSDFAAQHDHYLYGTPKKKA